MNGQMYGKDLELGRMWVRRFFQLYQGEDESGNPSDIILFQFPETRVLISHRTFTSIGMGEELMERMIDVMADTYETYFVYGRGRMEMRREEGVEPS